MSFLAASARMCFRRDVDARLAGRRHQTSEWRREWQRESRMQVVKMASMAVCLCYQRSSCGQLTPAPQLGGWNLSFDYRCTTRIEPLGCLAPCNPDACRHASIQEESSLCIPYHPLKTFLQVHSRHSTAGHNVPFVCLDGVESQSLYATVSIGPPTKLNMFVSRLQPTSQMSSSVMDPGTSLLFLKTSRLAPERRCSC